MILVFFVRVFYIRSRRMQTFCNCVSLFDLLQGDSGGPLVCQDCNGAWSVFGVTSFGRTGCLASYDARVQTHLGWIDQVVNDN